MAGLGENQQAGAGKAGPENATASLARAQYGALAGLRWHMFVNGLRSNLGTFELGARTVGFAIYAMMGLAMGMGLGVGAYAMARNDALRFLPILFWIVFLVWQLVPVSMASFQEQFDMSSLLRFPVGFAPFYLLHLIFGLADISTILGVLSCLGIWIGIVAARPELFVWTALALVAFAVFNILMARAVFAWIDRWLAQRKTREILGAAFLVLALSAQLLNPALHEKRHGAAASPEARAASKAAMQRWMPQVVAVQSWLPPGLAAQTLVRAEEPETALGSLGMLGIFALAAGGALAVRLRAEYRGESLGVAPAAKKMAPSRARAGRQGAWVLLGSGPMAAVMEKELRTTVRSMPLLYALGAPLVFVFLFGAMFRNSAPRGGHPFIFALPLAVAYALLGFTQLIYNNLGAEGAGIQVLFLSPTPIRSVLLAKNLFHSALFALDALLAAVLVTLRMGWPNAIVVAATLAWLLFALPSNLAVGNVFSLTMPYRINPGRLTRQRGSQGNALLSLLAQVTVLGVGAAVFGLCSLVGRLWLAVPVFVALAGGAMFAWMRVLRNSDGMANARRDALVATLMKDS
jgi:ABC-2 type transport system permease protein